MPMAYRCLPLLTLDLHAIPPELLRLCTHMSGDILDHKLLARLVTEYDFCLLYTSRCV